MHTSLQPKTNIKLLALWGIVAGVVAAVFGGLALVNLKQELIPSIEFPQLVVVSSYPGASPEVVANDVSGAGVGFDSEFNQALLLHAAGGETATPVLSKIELSRIIWSQIESHAVPKS